jgi:hypothetical protein
VSRIRREGFLRPGDQRRLQPYVVGLRREELEKMSWMTEEIAEGVRLWSGPAIASPFCTLGPTPIPGKNRDGA